MPNQAERDLVKHLSGAGKGLIEITEIIGRRRVEDTEYHLLTDVLAEVRFICEGGD
jgi:hypothetical protein